MTDAVTESADIRSELLGCLEADPPRDAELVRRIETSGPELPICSTLLHILTHLAFSEEEARHHWSAIRAHRKELQQDLSRDVGLRVAILDYFQNVARSLHNPKVIELRAYAETERSAISDGLTGLFNQTYFRQVLQREVQRARRHGRELSLVMLDLDDFKKINDSRGHVEGDRVLTSAADVIRSGLREIDLAARYGGEEFAVLLPDTPRNGGYAVADRIRSGIEKRFGRRRSHRVTVSGGVAACPSDARTAEDLVRRADSGLYQAKASGKNQIVLVDGNRRRQPRLPVRRRVTLSAASGHTATRTKNASSEGLLLSMREPLPVGSQLRLMFDPPEGEGRDLSGFVVRVDSAEGGAFDVGVRLEPRAGNGA